MNEANQVQDDLGKIYIPQTTYQFLPSMVKEGLKKLNKEQQKSFYKLYTSRRKTKRMGYISGLILGWHYLYMGKVGMQIVFWLTGGGLLIWWIIDMLRMPMIISKHNNDVAVETLKDTKALIG